MWNSSSSSSSSSTRVQEAERPTSSMEDTRRNIPKERSSNAAQDSRRTTVAAAVPKMRQQMTRKERTSAAMAQERRATSAVRQQVTTKKTHDQDDPPVVPMTVTAMRSMASFSTSAKPSMSGDDYYYCDKGHKLSTPSENKVDAMLHTCQYCKTEILNDLISSSNNYKCTRCDIYYVHGACLKASPKSHPFIPNFSLKFSPNKRGTNMGRCTVCCSSILGIMYTGTDHAHNAYNFHPPCLDLPSTLRPQQARGTTDSNFELQLYSQVAKNTKCAFCETCDDLGWWYGLVDSDSKRKNMMIFGCHVRCVKDRVAKNWLRKLIPITYRSRQAYFEAVYKRDVNKFAVMVGGWGLKAAVVGLDLMISAFVGAPLSTFLSLALGIANTAAKKKLKDMEKELRTRRH